MTKPHSERKHSKFSASGAERWFNCPGSVKLSEDIPSRDSKWSLEGTKAHEVLEATLRTEGKSLVKMPLNATREMALHAANAARFLFNLQGDDGKELLVETRIHLGFIHPDMFGTFDAAVVDHFDTLHVIDYKYGAGHAVSPKDSLQMLTYGMGLAHQYDWNFKKVRLWIIQPRIRGYDGPTFWELSISALKEYVSVFQKAVRRVEQRPDEYKEGSWCRWCAGKSICPLKQTKKLEQARAAFSKLP